MKRIIVCSLLLLLSVHLFGQPVVVDTAAPKIDYMKKSKKQRTVANIMLYGGLATFITGIAIATKEYDDLWVGLFGGDEKSDFTGAEIMLWTGFASMVGSVPLFIAAGRNRRKAIASLSFDMKKSYRMEPLTIKQFPYPALTIRFSIR